ncbi:MAG: hypothetical protein PWP23_1081 [Candidatus Sumerlaeota bacterium]|nr:hypothetical protein [Candidatus Sumerlaeota bacterium]
MSWRASARGMGLGRLAYRAYYRPRAFMRRCFDEGALNLLRSHRGRREMESAAARLRPSSVGASRDSQGAAIHFLTGRGYWYMTAFCAATLLRHAGRPLHLVIDDDGTLQPEHVAHLRRILGGISVRTPSEIAAALDEHLPTSEFPALRARRLAYPHLRKLTDIHAGCSGARLVLDSDMLFWSRPDALLGWQKKPDGALCMKDCDDSYGYSFDLMEQLVGAPLPRRLNVGIVGLDGESIDWPSLERWTRELLEREGSSYYQEQALTAMLFARRKVTFLDASRYVVKPGDAEVHSPSAALHHYVAESRHAYFQQAWHRAAESLKA